MHTVYSTVHSYMYIRIICMYNSIIIIHAYRVSQKKDTILNRYNFFNIHGRQMKQKLAESLDFKILLHEYIYFSYYPPLATIQFEYDG